MTEEIEKQAEEYLRKLNCSKCPYYDKGTIPHITCAQNEELSKVYKDGAKWGMEHAIEWHKAVERPKGYKQDFDVALKVLNYNTNQIEQDYGYYSVEYDKFYHSKSKFKIIAWCELPQYKE